MHSLLHRVPLPCSCACAAALFSRNGLTKPVALLPMLTSATTCVAFCPVVFVSPHDSNAASQAAAQNESAGASAAAEASHGTRLMELGYKLIFAIGSTDSVFIYDTGARLHACDHAAASILQHGNVAAMPLCCVVQLHVDFFTSPRLSLEQSQHVSGWQKMMSSYNKQSATQSAESTEPLMVLGAIHFKHVTDLAWSPDGRYLVATSHDGFCTIAAFAEGELGTPLKDDSVLAASLRERIAQQRPQPVCDRLLVCLSPRSNCQCLVVYWRGAKACDRCERFQTIPDASIGRT